MKTVTMKNIDFDFFLELIKYVFIPILLVVILISIAIFIYSKTIKEKDIKRYNYVVNFWTSLAAIVIVGALFAITIGFSRSLINSLIAYKLVESNKSFYYIVMALPLFPFIFLILYVTKFIKVVMNKVSKTKKLDKNLDIEQNDSRINYNPSKMDEQNKQVLPKPSVVEKKVENNDIEELF